MTKNFDPCRYKFLEDEVENNKINIILYSSPYVEKKKKTSLPSTIFMKMS